MRKIKNNKILYKMILTFSVAVSAVIIILSTVLSYYFEKMSTNEAYQHASSSLNQTSTMVQFLSIYVEGIYFQAIGEPEILKLTMLDKFESNTLQNSFKKLDSIRYSSPMMYSMYLYNDKAGIVFETGTMSQGWVNDAEYFYDQDFIERIQKIEDYQRYTPVFRMVPINGGLETDVTVPVYTYFFHTKNSTGAISNIMAINISNSLLNEFVGYFQVAGNASSNVQIINKAGSVVFSQKYVDLGMDYSQEPYIQKVINSKQDSGYFITEQEGSKKLVTYVKPNYVGYNDWCFVSVNDYESIIEPISQTRTIAMIISVSFLLVSLACVIILSAKLYVPISQTYSKVKQLEQAQHEKHKQDKEIYIKKLIEGDIFEDTEHVMLQLERFNINLNLSAIIQVAVVSIDRFLVIKKKSKENYKHIISEINNICSEIFNREFGTVLSLPLQDGYIAYAIQHAQVEEADLKVQYRRLYHEVSEQVEQKLNISVSMAVGNEGHSYRDLPYSLSEAVDADRYHYVLGYGNILFANELNNGMIEYPKQCEDQIINCLFAGKLAEAQAALQIFIDTISVTTVEQIQLSFLQLAYGIKYSSKNTTIEITSTLVNFEKFFSKLQLLDTIQEAHQMFLHLFQEIAELIDEQSKSKYEDLLSFITTYVSEQYSSVNLSLNDIGDQVNMSAAYLGRLLKQHIGISFNDYLNKYRLTKACEELRNTSKTINEISESSGFANTSYFYIVFKKNYHITPTQYRDNNLAQEG